MELNGRGYPLFALCGLNCCLCTRFHTDGPSKCPGCGGVEFSAKHPSCAVMTCNRKHDSVEYCYQCTAYPCKKYSDESKVDSFISYRNVKQNLENAKENLVKYQKELEDKHRILLLLLDLYNDGRSKSLYCNAVNLIPLEEMRKIMECIEKKIEDDSSEARAKIASVIIKKRAEELGIDLKLRK